MSSAVKIIDLARKVDDFIIDRVLQPGINHAAWHLRLPLYTLARLCTVLGAGIALIWVHDFDKPFSGDFWQDFACLLIMAGAAWLQIAAQERQAPRRPVFAPAIRLTGLVWRTLWLADLLLFPSQWPVQGHGQLFGNLLWTVLLVLPYWIICCRAAPPPERRVSRELRLIPIPVR